MLSRHRAIFSAFFRRRSSTSDRVGWNVSQSWNRQPFSLGDPPVLALGVNLPKMGEEDLRRDEYFVRRGFWGAARDTASHVRMLYYRMKER